MARYLYNSTDDAQKNGLRAKFLADLSDPQRQQLMQNNRGGDPLMHFFVQRAQRALQEKRDQAQQMSHQGQMQGGGAFFHSDTSHAAHLQPYSTSSSFGSLAGTGEPSQPWPHPGQQQQSQKEAALQNNPVLAMEQRRHLLSMQQRQESLEGQQKQDAIEGMNVGTRPPGSKATTTLQTASFE